MFSRRLGCALGLDDKDSIELPDQFCGIKTVQVFQNSVVRQNLHLIVRKNDAQEESAAARALPALINSGRGRAAMMAIGDVERVHACKLGLDELNALAIPD